MLGCPALMGVTLIFFGVLLLLENLGVSNDLIGNYWPVILIILGLASILNVYRWRVRLRRMGRRWPRDIDG